MGGFLGIGGSSANTDRATQLAGQQGLWSVFNYGLPTGQAQQAAGQGSLAQASSSLGPAQQYFQGLLQPGRTQAQLNAAPAINSTLDSADAARKQSANFGTSRSGGTAAINREAGVSTQSTIDNLINSNLIGGQQAGAQGLLGVSGAQAGIGATQLSNAANLLGLGTNAITSLTNNATQSKQNDPNVGLSIGSAIGQLFLNAAMGG
jgi:hypothetical protein